MRNKVRELRTALGLTQQDLAEHVNVSRQSIIAIEREKFIPSTLLAIRIARVLLQPVEAIFLPDEQER